MDKKRLSEKWRLSFLLLMTASGGFSGEYFVN